MKMAALPGDLDLLKLAQRDAKAIVAADGELALPEHALLKQVLRVQYGEALGVGDVG
jgi:hypothetical protein